jgi:uncharacterized protein YfaA (DUF2138 family)
MNDELEENLLAAHDYVCSCVDWPDKSEDDLDGCDVWGALCAAASAGIELGYRRGVKEQFEAVVAEISKTRAVNQRFTLTSSDLALALRDAKL